jgi:uncharacterized membrane protein
MTRNVDWRRAEFVLTLCGLLAFIGLLIRVKQLWGGLPAHPLFVHVPVVLIPVTVLAALVCLAKPKLLDRYGILICSVAIVAMASIFLAMQAGGALSGALHLQGLAAHLISEHSAAAKVLAICFTLLTAALILTFASHRISTGMPTGLTFADNILASKAIYTLLRVVVLVLALVAAFYIYRVGDLGAQAVWDGRLHAAGS